MKNKYIHITCLVTLLFSAGLMIAKAEPQEAMRVHVGARESKKVSLALIAITEDACVKNVCKTIAQDMTFTDQFEVTMLSMRSIPHKKEIHALEVSGYSLAVFITDNHRKKHFDIRMYDVKKGTMVTGKGYTIRKKEKAELFIAHEISDLLVQKLTHNEGVFCSKIAYSRETKTGSREVCVCDYDGTHERTIAKAKLLIAPRWNMNDLQPAVLYSRYTQSNVRLMEVDVITGKERVITSYEGLNMLPAFAPDTYEFVLCLSCKGSTQIYSAQYDRSKKITNYVQLTFNNGNNISPTMLENGSLIFCSDFQSGRPQLYKLDRENDLLTCLSESSDICFSPTYCPVNNKVIYTKMVEGIGQLFLYNIKTGKHTQLTFDQGHKQEASWSPCGNYVAFGFSNENLKRIGVQNVVTGSRRFITDEKMICTYPSWSVNFTADQVIK